MLRVPGRQALKAFCKPFPSPLRFSSSNPSPIEYFSQKKAEENIARGKFVDIHDIGPVDPKEYDVLITDIKDHTLHNEISDLVGIPYLKEATKEEADKKADSLVLSTAISTV